MRNFTEQENNLIKELVAIKKQGLSYIQELQVARILRLSFLFLLLNGLMEISLKSPYIIGKKIRIKQNNNIIVSAILFILSRSWNH